MADANVVPGRIDILTFLELRWSLACLWIFYNTKQLQRFFTMSAVSGAKAETAQQARSLVRAPVSDFDLNALPTCIGNLGGGGRSLILWSDTLLSAVLILQIFSIVNYYGKASSSQRTTFENMLNEGRETRSGSIRICKIPGRYKSWCKRAWENCNVWRWVNETELICSCTLSPLEATWRTLCSDGYEKHQKDPCWLPPHQRQTVVSQFFQLDRLVVEGGKSVRISHFGSSFLEPR